MPGLGHNAYLAVVTETTWGTKNITSMEFAEFSSENIEEKRPQKIVPAINNSRVFTKSVQLAKEVGGSINWDVNAEDLIGRILKNLLPAETFTDNGVGNGGLHVFDPSAALPVGLTIQIGRDTDVASYFGGRVSSLKLACKAGDMLKATAAMTFKDAVHGESVQTPSYTTQAPLLFHTGSFKINGTAFTIADFDIEISGAMKTKRAQIGSALILQQLPGPYDVKGNFTCYFDDLTQINAFLNGTAMKLDLLLTGANIGSTFNRSLEIIVPTAFYNGGQPVVSGAGSEIMIKVPFHAVQTGSGTPNQQVEIQLQNSRRTVY